MGAKNAVCAEQRAFRVRSRLELEPGPARHLHLGAQAQQPLRLDRLDPPEVECVAGAQVDRVAPAAAQADAADQPVEHAAQTPGPVHVEPAAFAAQAGEGAEDLLRRRGDDALPPLEDHPLPLVELDRREVALARGERVAPAVSTRPASSCPSARRTASR